MWVRLTFLKIEPGDVGAARALYYSEEISGVVRKQPGYRFHHLLESVERPGEVISLTAWNSQAEADAYEQGGVYESLLGKFGEWFAIPPAEGAIAVPRLETYEVHE
jgi:heme-degrading monooxygenase HmoA